MTPQELAELDLAVAKAEGYNYAEIVTEPQRYGREEPFVAVNGVLVSPTRVVAFCPSCDAHEAMRLMQKYRLQVWPGKSGWWAAGYREMEDGVPGQNGPTPAIAICRAVVALKEAEGGTDE